MPNKQMVHLVFHNNSISQCGLSIANLKYFVEEKEKVTCKNCLKWMNSDLGRKLGWGNKKAEEIHGKKWIIAIEEDNRKRKTRIFSVYSKGDRELLGSISWYPGWRCYIFEPGYNTVWSAGCLQEIIAILNELMDEWRRSHARRK